jgi:hypothetical protein
LMLLGGHRGWVFIWGELWREAGRPSTDFITKMNSNPPFPLGFGERG